MEEGPVGDDELSEVTFGSITTDDGVVLIEVWADVVRDAGLGRGDLLAGGRYRVELITESEYPPEPLMTGSELSASPIPATRRP